MHKLLEYYLLTGQKLLINPPNLIENENNKKRKSSHGTEAMTFTKSVCANLQALRVPSFHCNVVGTMQWKDEFFLCCFSLLEFQYRKSSWHK